MVRREFPKVELLVNDENLGGAGGFNRGMQHALDRGHGFIWLLDDDATVEAAALRAASYELAEVAAYQRYLQFVIERQWRRIRAVAAQRGVYLVGDLPFYVAHDSADVWTHPDLFRLDAKGRPLKLAGVPPDYFSRTGQLWGNPVYDWDRLAADGYGWWVRRISAQLERTDWIRLDHFRAFEAYWEVDAAENSAVRGRWAPMQRSITVTIPTGKSRCWN